MEISKSGDGRTYQQRSENEVKAVAVQAIMDSDFHIVGTLEQIEEGKFRSRVEISKLYPGVANAIMDAIINHLKHVTLSEN